MYPTSRYYNYKYICPQPTLDHITRHIDKNTLRVGDLNTPLSAIDRSPKQEISNETRALNAKLDELDLIDIYRTLHPEPKNTHSILMPMEHFQE